MKNYIISGQVANYRIKVNLFAASPNSAINIFKQKYPKAGDIFIIQDLFKKALFKSYFPGDTRSLKSPSESPS